MSSNLEQMPIPRTLHIIIEHQTTVFGFSMLVRAIERLQQLHKCILPPHRSEFQFFSVGLNTVPTDRRECFVRKFLLGTELIHFCQLIGTIIWNLSWKFKYKTDDVQIYIQGYDTSLELGVEGDGLELGESIQCTVYITFTASLLECSTVTLAYWYLVSSWIIPRELKPTWHWELDSIILLCYYWGHPPKRETRF